MAGRDADDSAILSSRSGLPGGHRRLPCGTDHRPPHRLVDGFPNGVIPTRCQDPVRVQPAAVRSRSQRRTAIRISRSGRNRQRGDQFTVRIDHKINDHQNFSAYYYFNDIAQLQPFTNFEAAGANVPVSATTTTPVPAVELHPYLDHQQRGGERGALHLHARRRAGIPEPKLRNSCRTPAPERPRPSALPVPRILPPSPGAVRDRRQSWDHSGFSAPNLRAFPSSAFRAALASAITSKAFCPRWETAFSGRTASLG